MPLYLSPQMSQIQYIDPVQIQDDVPGTSAAISA